MALRGRRIRYPARQASYVSASPRKRGGGRPVGRVGLAGPRVAVAVAVAVAHHEALKALAFSISRPGRASPPL
jgi:hypothetical protein